MAFFKYIVQDFEKNKGNTKGKIIGFCYRLANYVVGKPTPIKLLFTPYIIFYKFIFEWLFCIEIPYKTSIGKGIAIYHGHGIVINEKTKIGNNCKIRHNVTIGNSKSYGGCPVIGNNVEIGALCVIIGDITIGDYCVIGAGTIVTKDVPSYSIVVGNPSRIIGSLKNEKKS